MRKFNQLLGLLLCVFYSSAWAQIQNGSFESWSSGTPDGWTTIDDGIDLDQNSSVTKEGNYSAAVTVNTSTQGNTDLWQNVSVNPGQSYEFSVWGYHTEGRVRARLYIDGYRVYSRPSVANQWQQITYTYTPSSSSIDVGLRFYDVPGFDRSEVVYVDYYEPTTPTDNGY